MKSWFDELPDESNQPGDQFMSWDTGENQDAIPSTSASEREHVHKDTAQLPTPEDNLSRAIEGMELDGIHDSGSSRSHSIPSDGNLFVTDLGFAPVEETGAEETKGESSSRQSSRSKERTRGAYGPVQTSVFEAQPSRMALVDVLPPLERYRRSRISFDRSMHAIPEVDSIQSRESSNTMEIELNPSPIDAYIVTSGIDPEATVAEQTASDAASQYSEVESPTATVRRPQTPSTPARSVRGTRYIRPPDSYETRAFRPRRGVIRGPRPQPQLSNLPQSPPAYPVTFTFQGPLYSAVMPQRRDPTPTPVGGFADDNQAVGVSFEENVDESTLEVSDLSIYFSYRHADCYQGDSEIPFIQGEAMRDPLRDLMRRFHIAQ